METKIFLLGKQPTGVGVIIHYSRSKLQGNWLKEGL
jgi:hypothetical protein